MEPCKRPANGAGTFSASRSPARTVVGHFHVGHATASREADMRTDEIDLQLDDDDEHDARRAIVRALNRDPYDVWTSGSLALAVGASPALTGRILQQLASAGMVHRLGDDEGFTVMGDGE
jgi:hypothetical protein